jgi:hypothetical protein
MKKSQSYQLKISLDGIRPPIWRRFEVPADITLHQLHQIIQIVMGWLDGHLHEFEIDGKVYSDPDLNDCESDLDENGYTLSEILVPSLKKFRYNYDFGDYWQHTIAVEESSSDKTVPVPRVLKGRRCCPPEDCGGVYGYSELLEIIADPSHKRHREIIDWLGPEFHPDEFLIDDVNADLAGMSLSDS